MHSRGSPHAAAGPVDLPNEVLHSIFQRLPPNCIPLAIRQLNKELHEHYRQHTTVQAIGTAYVPLWVVLAALRPTTRGRQMRKLVAATARYDDLECMRQIAQHVQARGIKGWVGTRTLEAAAAGGQLNILRWLIEEQGCRAVLQHSAACSEAASGGHVHVLEWLRAQEPPAPWGDCAAAAAKAGRIDILEWLREHGCSLWGAHVWAAAARAGQLQTLQFLRAICPSLDCTIMLGATEGGHLDVVRWLQQHGCNWHWAACRTAMSRGHLHVLEYLLQHGCPMYGVDLCRMAADAGNRDMLAWLRERGQPWSAAVCTAAVTFGGLAMLQWLREQEPPCPWDTLLLMALTRSRREDAAECLEYALSNGCPWDKWTFRRVQQNPKLRHVQFPGRRRSTRRLKA